MQDLLLPFGPLSTRAVADVLIMMSKTLADASPLHTWNTDIFVDAAMEHTPSLDWLKVAEALDSETFFCPSAQAFKLLVEAFLRAGIVPFLVQVLCGGLWSNASGQLSLIRQAVAAPPEVFSFEHTLRRAAPVEGMLGGKSPCGTPNQAWLCLDLLETLFHLAEQSEARKAAVCQILEEPLQACPEVRRLGQAVLSFCWG